MENGCTCILRRCAMCEKEENTIANLARATKFSELWDPTTFMDKYDVTGRPVPFHWHIFSGHTTIQLKREKFRQSWDPRNRGISEAEAYSCLCSTTLKIRNLAMSKHVPKTQKRLPTCKAIPVRSLVFLWIWPRKSVVPMTQEFEEAPHPIFYCAEPFFERRSQVQEGQRHHSLSEYDSNKDNHYSHFFWHAISYASTSQCVSGLIRTIKTKNYVIVKNQNFL